ncbi:pentraxin fusion -like protein [Labeo rohita]|nr:pentraxin fusion -like protein [Labeo rohita]
MRVTTGLQDERDIILFAYRTPDTDELNVWKERDGRFSLYIQSCCDGVLFRMAPLSPYRTHLCVTWNSGNGFTAVWVDGQRSSVQTCRKMLPMVLFFSLLFLKPVATNEGLSGKMLVFPSKSSNSYVELTPEKPMSLSAFTLCMDVSADLQDERDIILFAYRTSDNDELNVWKEEDGRFSLYLKSNIYGALFRLLPLPTYDTHLCVTWNSTNGFTAFWVDGQRSSLQVYRKGHEVRKGGVVVLGQDPDSYLGGFDREQSFVGEIKDVYMWDYVLSDNQIKAVYLKKKVSMPKGNMLSWNTIKYNTFGKTCRKMLPVVLFFSLLFLKPVATNEGLGGKMLVFPSKSSSSYVELTPEKPMSLSAFTLCMRVTTELWDVREIILFAYRTPDTDELNVWKEKDGRFSLYFQSSHDGVLFNLTLPSPYHTHLCVTWNSANGLTAFWVDGRRSSLQVYKTGHRVRAGGVVLLGQDPDDYLGDFDPEQSFVGEMKDVYMWDYVLSDNQIKAVYSNQESSMPKGNVLNWNTTKYYAHGNVTCIKMLALFFCLYLFLTPAATEVGLAGKVILFPNETATSFVKLTPEKPLSLSAFTLCMRVATELQGAREIILFAYRTQDYDELNVWREKDGRLSLYLQSSSNGALFYLPPLSTFQTHLCITWDSATGLTAFWVDGHRSVFQLYKKGHSIRPGGAILLGQDPDSYVGDFDAGQSFVGEITDVQMWDHVFSGTEIRAVCSNQEPYVPKGNMFDWNTIKYEITGNVVVAQNN